MSVCSRFKKDVFSTERRISPYQDQNGTCTQYSYNKTEDDRRALIELNYMRWLVGFERPTVLAEGYDDELIQCAITNVANGKLNHEPTPASLCYTPGAFAACSSSNLGAGFRDYDASSSIQQFIMDSGDTNKIVGHRQWVFSSGLGKTAFGGAYNSKSPDISGSVAMKVFNMGYSSPEILPFTAYPPPGYFPAQFVYNRFSFWAPGASGSSHMELSVKINDEPQNISEIVNLGNGIMFVLADYGESSYDVPYYKIVNKRIDVHITDNATKTDYDYAIYPIDCSDKPMRTPVPTIEGDDYDKLDIGEAPKQKRQKKVAIGAGVGVSLVVIVIIILVLFIVFRHGCSHNHDNDETNNNNNNDNNDDHSESGENHLEDA